MSVTRPGSKVLIEAEVLTAPAIHTTKSGKSIEYVQARIRGTANPVIVVTSEIQPFRLGGFQLTDLDFDPSRPPLARNIRHYRQKAGLSQYDLAKAAGVAQTTIWRWETGDGEPMVGRLKQLAKALGVSLDELFAEPAERAA